MKYEYCEISRVMLSNKIWHCMIIKNTVEKYVLGKNYVECTENREYV